MVSREQASNRKNGTKFDIIKTMSNLQDQSKEGTAAHYDSMLQMRKSGQKVKRRRDESPDSPFDDEKGNERLQ